VRYGHLWDRAGIGLPPFLRLGGAVLGSTARGGSRLARGRDFCSNGYHHRCPDNLKKSFPPERMTEAVFSGTPRDHPVRDGNDQFSERREKPA
jgi:hypothetical protein